MNTAHPRPVDRSRRWAETMIAHLDGGRVILDGRHELVTTNLSRRILD
jgi:hypothetical protein